MGYDGICTVYIYTKQSSPRPNLYLFSCSLPFDHSFFDVMYGEAAVQPPALSSFCWGRGDSKISKGEERVMINVPNSLENKALACCEWQKVVAFLHSESVAYLLGQR